MNIIGFSGSPRRGGSNIWAVGQVLDGARDAGANTQLFSASELDIKPCQAPSEKTCEPDAMKFVTETERLVLREMTRDDLPATWEIDGDDETMYAWNGAWSERENIERLEKQLRSYAENGFGRWAVLLKDTGRVIGMCGLMWWDTDKDCVLELGYLSNRAFWHNGYAAEAATACKRYAFDALGFDEVFSLIRDNNYASMNVAIRCGMLVRGRYIKRYKDEDMPHYIFSARKTGCGQ
jgi:RimJ/RimL family protein N-acetyltransferase